MENKSFKIIIIQKKNLKKDLFYNSLSHVLNVNTVEMILFEIKHYKSKINNML
jgi:hypothetical protein